MVDERIPARLLAIATEHIRRHGSGRVTVVGVAEEAGMSHANVYRFFASKAALIEAVVVAWLRTVELALVDIANAPDPADDKLERFLLAWAKAHRDKLDHDPAVYQAVLVAWGKGRPVITAHRQRLRTLIGRIVDEGLMPGPFRVRDEDKAIAVVIDGFQRFAHPYLVHEARELSRPAHELRTGSAARLIVRGLVMGSV